MGKYILAHDLGTSGNKAVLYNKQGKLIGSHLSSYKTFYPSLNWAEQNPFDWWEAVCKSTKELIFKIGIKKEEIAVISFSAQMMGCVPLDKNGEPLCRSIIWADQRSTKQAQELKNRVGSDKVYRLTGHRISPSYSLEKIMWIRENQPLIYEKTYKFVQAKDYIVNKLTGEFVTDYSDASGMNIYDIQQKCWSDEIIDKSGIDKNKLPRVCSSFTIVGGVLKEVAQDVGLKAGTPVVLGAGDGAAAGVGAGVVQEGSAYNYIGSSSWIALATQNPILDSEQKTFNWIHMDPKMYMPCGTMQTAGASFDWLRNTFCQTEEQAAKNLDLSVYQIMNLAAEKSQVGSNNLLYLPYLMGERSPYWNPNAKGAFIGLTLRHNKSDIIRSVLEGVSFNLKIISEIFEDEINFSEIRLIGGGAKGRTWRRIMADIYNKTVLRPQILEEATSLGAAIAGGIGVGIFSGVEVAEKLNPVIERELPNQKNVEKYQQLYSVFKDSYSSLTEVYDNLAKID